MNEYKCFICRETYAVEEDLPELDENEALLCTPCAEWVDLQNNMPKAVTDEL